MRTVGRQFVWYVSIKVSTVAIAWLGYEGLVLTGGHVLVMR